MIRIRLINQGRVVKQITSRVHESVVLEQIKKYKDQFDTVQIVEGELSEGAKEMLHHVARKIIPAAMAAGVAISGAGAANAQGGANPNYPGLNHSVGQHMADIFSPNYKEAMRQREYNRSTERQVWNAAQNEIRKQRVIDARAAAGGGQSASGPKMYDQSRVSQDGKYYIIYGLDNTVKRIPVAGTEYMPGDSQRLSHYITSGGGVYYVRHPHMNESVNQGVAEGAEDRVRQVNDTEYNRLTLLAKEAGITLTGIGADKVTGDLHWQGDKRDGRRVSGTVKKVPAKPGVAEGSGGNWYIRVNGKILNDTKFKPVIFSSEDEARSHAMKLADKKHIPLSQIKLTKSWMDAPESGVTEGYSVTRGIDKDRYQARDGLEGPFSTKSGKVVYYDKKEGKYYDPDTDFYIGHEDYAKMDESSSTEVEHNKGYSDASNGVKKNPYNPGSPSAKAYDDGQHAYSRHFSEDATVGTIPASGTVGTSGGTGRTQFAPTGKTTNAQFNKNGQIELDTEQEDDGSVNLDADAVKQLQQAGVKMNENEDSPVAAAIARRIMSQRLDLLKQYGPVLVTQAVDEVADFVGDVEEIGSSDVSGWVKQVEQMLRDNPPETFGEAITEGSDTLEGILSKFSTDYAKFRAGGDIDENQDFFDALYEYYSNSGEMPYGVQKARDGDPYEWITDRLDQEGGVAPVAEADDDSTADQNIIMQLRKVSDYQKPTKIKLADGTASVIAPNIAKQLLAKFDKMKPDSKTLLQDTLNTEQGFAEILDYFGSGVREQAAARAGNIMQAAMIEAGFGRNSQDAYQRDYDSSVAGMGKRGSYAYSQDGGANDEGWDRPEYQAPQETYYLRFKDTGLVYKQKDIPKSFANKAAANGYALAMVKNKPALKGNLLLTVSSKDKTA